MRLGWLVLLAAACNSDPGAGSWTPTTPMPLRRAFAAVGVIQGHIVVAGGLTDACAGGAPLCDTDEVDVYDPKTLTWEVGAPLPPGAPRHHISAGVYLDRLYVLNGFTGTATPALTAWRYDLIGWTRRSDPPIARGDAAATNLGGIVWVAGGRVGGGGTLADVWGYDAAHDTWKPGAAMPTPRSAAGACGDGQRMFVVGGRNAGGGVVATAEIYDTEQNSWSSLPDLPTARADLAALPFAGECHAMGGVDAAGLPSAAHDATTADSGWRSYAPLLSPRAGAVSATVGAGQIHVIGGTSAGGAFLPSVDLWTPSL